MSTPARTKRRQAGGVSVETLRVETEGGKRWPFYLLSGEEDFERDNVCDWLIERLTPEAAPEFNLDVFHGDSFDPERLIDCYSAYPMLAGHRLVVLKNCERLSADQTKQLDSVVSNPQESSILLAVGGKIDMRRRFFQQLGKIGRRLEFKTPYPNQIPSWLAQHARGRGLKLDLEAAGLLSLYVGNNLRELANEVEKLSIFVGEGRAISREDVMNLVGISHAGGIFEFADTVGRQNYPEAQNMLQTLLAHGEEPLRILPMLSRHLQLLLKALDCTTATDSEAAARLGVSPFFVKSYREQASQFKADQLWTGLQLMLDADRLLKSRRRHQHAHILHLCISRLCEL